MAEPKKNTAFTFSIGLVDRSARPSFKAAPTLAAGDFKVSIDGAAFANLASLPTVTPAAGTRVEIALSAAEMNGENILVQCIDAAGSEWDDVIVTLDTSVRVTDDLATPTNITAATGIVLSGVTHTGAVIPTVSAVTGLTAANLDTTISSRMATYTQPTGFLAATFPTGTVANTTNITAGTITTVTTVTNQLTAAQVATGVWQDTTAGDFTVASSIGKSLYTTGNAPGAASGIALVGSNMGTASSVTGAVGSVTGNVGGNVAGSVASVTAGVTVTTNNDKTGYGLSSAAVQAVWDALTSALTTVGSIGKLIVDNLNATISSRMASYTQPTGFLAATFPTTVASTTNITAATGVVLSGVTHTGAVIPTVSAVTGLTAATVHSDLDDIQARLPAALVGGRMDSTVSAIGNDTTALTAFKRAVLGNVIATVGAASSTTSIVTSSMTPAAAVTDQFKNRIVIFDKDTTTANLRGQAAQITASTAAGVLTVSTLTTAPVSGDTFTVL